MYKLKLFEIIILAAREVFIRGRLPEDMETFFDLVRQYGKHVAPDLKEGELEEFSNFISLLTMVENKP